MWCPSDGLPSVTYCGKNANTNQPLSVRLPIQLRVFDYIESSFVRLIGINHVRFLSTNVLVEVDYQPSFDGAHSRRFPYFCEKIEFSAYEEASICYSVRLQRLQLVYLFVQIGKRTILVFKFILHLSLHFRTEWYRALRSCRLLRGTIVDLRYTQRHNIFTIFF